MKVFDCFIFHNELDVLEIRLHELDPIIDHFVLVEATTTFSGQTKPLWYEENKERYKEFAQKIIHIVVDDMPEICNGNRWPPQIHQRRQIAKGLQACVPEDIVMISDVDEIPSRALVAEVIGKLSEPSRVQDLLEISYCYLQKLEKILLSGNSCPLLASICRRLKRHMLPKKRVYRFRHRHYEYYLNGYVNDRWLGTAAMRYSSLAKVFDTDCNEPRRFRPEDNRGSLRGGWHFTYMGGVDRIAYKIENLSEDRFDPMQFGDKEWIQECIDEGKNLYGKTGKGHIITYVEVDDTFPAYVQNNPVFMERHVKC